jgi:hypothetical protein
MKNPSRFTDSRGKIFRPPALRNAGGRNFSRNAREAHAAERIQFSKTQQKPLGIGDAKR